MYMQVRVAVKCEDLLQSSLRLSIWDHDEGKDADPMGAVEIPLQELSFSAPIAERMYVVTLDKTVVSSGDEDDGRLIEKSGASCASKDTRDVMHAERQLDVPWPDEPSLGEPGLQFAVQLGPSRRVTTPDRSVRVTCKHAFNLRHPDAARQRAGIGPDAVVCVSLSGREKKTKVRLATCAPVWNQVVQMPAWSDMLDATLLLEIQHEDELGRHVLLGRTSLELSSMVVGDKLQLHSKMQGGELLAPSAAQSAATSSRPTTVRAHDGRVVKPASAPEPAMPELVYSVEMLGYDSSRTHDAQLRVRAVQARGLAAMDFGGTSDPYLVVR
jgi:hypothetical protein